MASARLVDRVDELDTRFSRRLSELGDKVARLSERLPEPNAGNAAAWWTRLVGVYGNDPAFDEAERLSREYRAFLDRNDTEATV